MTVGYKPSFALLACLLIVLAVEASNAKGAKSNSGKAKTGKKGDEVLCEACKALSMEIGPKVMKLVKRLGKGRDIYRPFSFPLMTPPVKMRV